LISGNSAFNWVFLINPSVPTENTQNQKLAKDLPIFYLYIIRAKNYYMTGFFYQRPQPRQQYHPTNCKGSSSF